MLSLAITVVAVVVFMFDPDPSNASETVGAMAMGFNILMYASPLTVCMKVRGCGFWFGAFEQQP